MGEGGGSTGDSAFDMRFDWSAARLLEAKVATHFLVQIGMPSGSAPDGVHLIIGHANPPVIVADDEQGRVEQAATYGGKLPVTVHGRYHISRARLEELRTLLNDLAETYDGLGKANGEGLS